MKTAHRSTTTRRVAVGFLVLLAATSASADPRTVDLVTIPGETTTQLAPNGLLPAGEAFQVRIAAPESAERMVSGGSLEIWPGDHGACDRSSRPSGDRQHYFIALRASGTGAERVLSGEVPVLQLGTHYCFELVRAALLNDTELTALTQATAPRIAAALGAAPQCQFTDGASWQRARSTVERALHDSIGQILPQGSIARELNDATRTIVASYVANGAEACRALSATQANAKAKGDAAAHQLKARDDARAQLAKPGPALPSPRAGHVVVGLPNNPTYVSLRTIAASGSPAQLTEATARLDALAARFPALRADAERWRALLSRAAKLAPAERKKEATALPLPAFPAVLWDVATSPPAPVGPEAFAAAPPPGPPTTPPPPGDAAAAFKARLDSAVKQLDALKAQVGEAGAGPIETWRTAILRFETAEQGLTDAVARKNAADDALRKAEEDHGKAIDGAMHATAVREDLRFAIRASFADTPGSGVTPAAGYFVAVDAGVAVALPMVAAASKPWLAPYLGLNFYLQPVDRRIPLRALAGDRWAHTLQRASLTVGTTVTAPGIPGRATDTLVFGAYPLAAVGWRLTSYTRVSLGSMWFRVSKANPASTRKELAWAPFLGVSVDADVLSLIPKGP